MLSAQKITSVYKSAALQGRNKTSQYRFDKYDNDSNNENKGDAKNEKRFNEVLREATSKARKSP